MLILHTADWHLGRSLKGASRLDDQAEALDQIVRIAEEAQPDLVVIAGDVFDRSVPSADAVELLDDTLARLVLSAGLPVVMIAGNHDDPRRLGFGARLLSERGLFIAGALDGAPARLLFDDAWGPVEVVPLPFAEPARVGTALGMDPLPTSQDQAVAAALAAVPREDEGARRVLVGHLFAAGGQLSGPDSERAETVGTLDQVSLGRFDAFDYVALGHLHAPHALSGGRLRYAGSPLAHSFDEAGQTKSVAMVELDAGGSVAVETVPLVPRRAVRVLRGTLEALLRQDANEDWIQADLDDTVRPLGAFERLKAVWPNFLGFAPRPIGDVPSFSHAVPVDPRIEAPEALFAAFWEAMTRSPLDPARHRLLADAIRAARSDAAGRTSEAAE